MSTIVSEASSTDTTEEDQHLPPTICEPWCRDGRGHIDADSVDDQWCFSGSEVRVPMTRERLVRLPGGGRALDDMRVYAAREFEGRPFVSLSRGEAQGVSLTPAEAIELSEALAQHARMIQAHSARLA